MAGTFIFNYTNAHAGNINDDIIGAFGKLLMS